MKTIGVSPMTLNELRDRIRESAVRRGQAKRNVSFVRTGFVLSKLKQTSKHALHNYQFELEGY